MLAWYWDTVSRWMVLRARRDARTLREQLYVIQAVDRAEGLTKDSESTIRAMQLQATKLISAWKDASPAGVNGNKHFLQCEHGKVYSPKYGEYCNEFHKEEPRPNVFGEENIVTWNAARSNE